jgi:hypothetical protein
MQKLEARVGELGRLLALAEQTRDAAREASNKDLQARRDAEQQVRMMRRALAFARSVIKSGEPWTDTCELEIGSFLK